ncbi:MAG: O-antigen ligase family protein [Bacteroidales bacterium]|nr:O-antigen ligase family protein [Bacteroidales bacterium]
MPAIKLNQAYRILLYVIFAAMYNLDGVFVFSKLSWSVFLVFSGLFLCFINSLNTGFCITKKAQVFLVLYLFCILFIATQELYFAIVLKQDASFGSIISLIPALLIIVLSTKVDRKYYNNLIYFFCYGIQIHVFYGAFQYFMALNGTIIGNTIALPGLIRVSGLYHDSNIFGYSVIMAVGVGIYGLLYSKNIYYKAIFMFILFIDLFVAVGTGSRTTILCSYILMPLTVVILIIKPYQKLVIFVGLFFVTFLLYPIVMPMLENIFNLIGRGGKLSNDIRISYLWKTAMLLLQKNFFLGNGYDYMIKATGYGTHNMFLTVLLDRGILGFVVYFLPFAYGLIAEKTRNHSCDIANILIIGYLYGGLGISNWILRVPMVLLFLVLNLKGNVKQSITPHSRQSFRNASSCIDSLQSWK